MISNKLKEAGLKVTLPRIKILETLEDNRGSHASVEDIYKLLMDRGEEISIATIYRVLTQCEQAGLVSRLQFENDRAVFEIAEEDHHDHIICVRCGHVEEFHDALIENRQKEVANAAGFDMEDHSMILYGLCRNCRNNSV